MAELNPKTDATKKVIHLMVTPLCNRNCRYCCNKQYDINDISYVTDEELREAEVLCLTGGEPFFVYGSMLDRPALQKEIFKHKKSICIY